MELQEAKDAVLQLMKEKDKIEDDLRVLKEILDCVRILCMILFPTEPNYHRQNCFVQHDLSNFSLYTFRIIVESYWHGRITGGCGRISQAGYRHLSSETHEAQNNMCVNIFR